MSDCICEGNWRKIVKDSAPKFGRPYLHVHTGDIYTFIGVMHCDDDYYYCMTSDKGVLQRLSCVGYIEMFGYEEILDD